MIVTLMLFWVSLPWEILTDFFLAFFSEQILGMLTDVFLAFFSEQILGMLT